MNKIVTIVLCAATIALSAAEINVNSNFKKSKLKAAAPYGWLKNHASNPQIGKTEIIAGKKTGEFALKVTAVKKATPMYTSSSYPVKPGDIVKMSVDTAGKGSVSLLCYAYDAKDGYKCNFSLKMTATKVPGIVEGIYAIPAKVNYAKVRFVFQTNPNSDIVFSNVKADISVSKTAK